MKIIHFHPDPQMAERFVKPLITYERRHGFKSFLISSLKRSNIKFKHFNIPYDLTLFNILKLPLTITRILHILLRVNPEIIISHNSKSSVLPLILSYIVGIKHRIYYNHGVPYTAYTGLIRLSLYSVEILNILFSSQIITVSEPMRQILQDNFPNSKNVLFIHNGSACGIELDSFQIYNSIQKAEFRRHFNFNLKPEDFVFIFIGRPLERKGFPLIIKIWDKYIKQENMKLILCGPTDKDLIKVINKIPSNIISFGFVKNINEVLACSDILLLPSYHEGLSYACMEAQASGVVIVGNNINGINCLIDNNKTGYLIDKNSVKEYVRIIKNIMSDRNSLDIISCNARISVEKYSRTIFLKHYINFLKNLILVNESN